MKNIISPQSALMAVSLLFMTASSSANELDPLSADELMQAAQLASPAYGLRTTRQQGKTATATAPAIEQLLIERRPTDKEQPVQRLADVYSYDYGSDETLHNVVDLQTQRVISSQRQQYLQLPLTENELARATRLIFSDPEQMRPLQDEYKRITGQVLNNPDQLNVKAFTFTADALPERLNAASQQCGLHRCAQVLLYTHDSIVFEISPIVNLSAGIVTQNIGF